MAQRGNHADSPITQWFLRLPLFSSSKKRSDQQMEINVTETVNEKVEVPI